MPQLVRPGLILVLFVSICFACRDTKEPKIQFDAKTGRVKIQYGTERLIDSVVAKPQLQSIDHVKLGRVWLVKFSRSDSCPSEYIALLPEGRTSEIFGNCNDIAEIRHEPEYVSLLFAEDAETQRAAEKVNLQ
ncbi:hypothetical protein [Turneriella parva]|uniref:Uncharacterized protein n=1 Tax=Turneriella parva (strain ATCC BAA-1111 / DSM 21527 / NCTC 11395 / H) TaxID=869212 RepID=I4BBS4_TURPD|nr:hypothetical protein [Turneriella parva]AFM14731.1 hypothetical protein Turpa_4098 [Turneriella parva DSM 21527]